MSTNLPFEKGQAVELPRTVLSEVTVIMRWDIERICREIGVRFARVIYDKRRPDGKWLTIIYPSDPDLKSYEDYRGSDTIPS